MIAVVLLAAALGDGATPLVVRPMAAPKPALRYQLLPEVREMNAGNAVQWYLRCFAEQRNFFFGKQGVEERARYRGMTLPELAKEQLRNYGGSALTQADWAARLTTADWDPEPRAPELPAFRVLAQSLQVRFRGEVARQDFDNAIRTAKTMLGFARHLSENPNLEANRLGLEVAELALDTLEEFLQQPGAPNLYWALTDLPSPLVPLRKGFQGERVQVDLELAVLLADEAMSDDELEQFVSRLSGRIGSLREQAGRSPKNVRTAIKARVDDRERVARIRNRLLSEAPSAGVLDKLAAIKFLSFSPLQLILLDERTDFESRRDESLKLLGFAPWQLDAMKLQTDRGDGIFADFLPRVPDQVRIQARVDQRIALLRWVESIRLHAASHDGKPPQTPSEIAMPLPVDPFTGKPFGYALEGAVVIISGSGKSYSITVK